MAGSRIRNALSFRSPLTRLSGVAAVSAVVALAGCSGAPATPGGTGPAGSGTGTSQGSPSAPPSSGSAGATASAESTVKALVAGFPVKLIPLMGGAVIGQSTLERGTPISKAGVTFDVSAKTADVMAYYAKSSPASHSRRCPARRWQGCRRRPLCAPTGGKAWRFPRSSPGPPPP